MCVYVYLHQSLSFSYLLTDLSNVKQQCYQLKVCLLKVLLLAAHKQTKKKIDYLRQHTVDRTVNPQPTFSEYYIKTHCHFLFLCPIQLTVAVDLLWNVTSHFFPYRQHSDSN